MTCNGQSSPGNDTLGTALLISRIPLIDLGLIPFEKLPLQCTLLFSPPNAPLLEAYLTEISILERGGSLPHAYLPDLLKAANYDHPTELILQQPLAPVTLRQVKGIDLRMSIMQLQLDVGGSKSRPQASLSNNFNVSQAEHAAPTAQKWKDIEKQAETRSILDAHLALNATTCLEVKFRTQIPASLVQLTVGIRSRSSKSTDTSRPRTMKRACIWSRNRFRPLTFQSYRPFPDQARWRRRCGRCPEIRGACNKRLRSRSPDWQGTGESICYSRAQDENSNLWFRQ